MKFIITIAAIFLLNHFVLAQDSMRKKEVNITSTFKPTLKEAAKININATPPTPDTTRPRLQYNIPNQNLAFAFQPGTLKPLALQVDSGGSWSNESYAKLGYGNLNTPFLQAGLSVGDGKKYGLNVYGKHYSSKGKIALQDVSHTNVDVAAFFQTSNNLEWNARIGSVQEKYNKFGFLPKTLVLPDDSTKVKFQTLRGRVGFHNINRTAFGLTYSPEIKIEAFSDGLSNSESNTTINLPLHKTIGTKFEAVVAVEVNLTNYKPENKTNVNNYWVMASPSFLYKTGPLNLQAGVRPTWDNGAFKLLPNIFVEFNTNDNLLAVQAGWNGYMRNSGFQYSANMNPWIWAPNTVYNSRIEERYAGVKGSTGDHLSYSAKISFNKVTNQPLFMNDTMSGKSFLVINEADMDVVNFAGGLGYTIGEKFSVLSHITLNRYNPKVSKEAWGLLPLEWNNTLKLQVLKDLYVNTTLYAFGGPQSKSKSGEKMLQGAMDLTAGLEFKIVKNVKLWAQFNNIFNSEYQRWNQYPNYGFNFLGGVVFSFAQNK